MSTAAAAIAGGETQDNRQKYLLWAGYVVFFVFCFFMFAYMTFPYERLRDIIIDQFTAGLHSEGTKTTVEIEELSPHWLTGVQLEGVTITRTPEPAGDPTVFTIDELTVRAAPIAYLFGDIDVSFGAVAGDGSIEGNYVTDEEGKGKRVVAELDAFDLGKLGVGSFLGMPMTGVATGTVDLDLPEEIAASAGTVDIEIAGLTIGDGKNRMKIIPGMGAGLVLDPIDAGTLKMKMTIKEGVAAVETFEADGKDVKLDGSGSVRLASPWDRSRADLTIGFKIEDAYKNKSEKSKIALELMSGNPVIKSATGSDGMTRLQLSGVVTMLRPRPALPGGAAKKPLNRATSKAKKGKKGEEDEAAAE